MLALLGRLRSFFTPWWKRPLTALAVGLVFGVLLATSFGGPLRSVASSLSSVTLENPALSPEAKERAELFKMLEEDRVQRERDMASAPASSPKKGKKGAKAKAPEPVVAPTSQAVAAAEARPAIDIRSGHVALALAVLMTLGAWLALSSFAGRIYYKRLERLAAQARATARRDCEAAKAHNDRIEYYRMYPLTDHTLCTACGWIGRFRSKAPTYSGTKAFGGIAAVGGAGVAAAGCGGSAVGIILIIIGIPLLLVFGLGLIPIGIGSIMLAVGGTATAAGTTIASSGASAVSKASHAARNAAAAPNQCPTCKNVELIPALSPMGIHQINNTPTVAAVAQNESQKVIESLPHVIAITELPELHG